MLWFLSSNVGHYKGQLLQSMNARNVEPLWRYKKRAARYTNLLFNFKSSWNYHNHFLQNHDKFCTLHMRGTEINCCWKHITKYILLYNMSLSFCQCAAQSDNFTDVSEDYAASIFRADHWWRQHNHWQYSQSTTKKTQRFTQFISVRRSTGFRRFFRPSSGAQNCTYSVRYLSDQYLTLYVQFWAPDDGQKNRLKPVERLTEINCVKRCIFLVVLCEYCQWFCCLHQWSALKMDAE